MAGDIAGGDARGVIDKLIGFIGRVDQIDTAPAFMNIGNGEAVIVNTIVIFIQHVHG